MLLTYIWAIFFIVIVLKYKKEIAYLFSRLTTIKAIL